MGLDIIFLEDIRNALMAADEASSATARACAAMGGDGRDESATCLYLWAYLEGYRAALTTVALAFGLSPAIITSQRGPLEVEARAVEYMMHDARAPYPSCIGHLSEKR
jgi:hypothetical protein